MVGRLLDHVYWRSAGTVCDSRDSLFSHALRQVGDQSIVIEQAKAGRIYLPKHINRKQDGLHSVGLMTNACSNIYEAEGTCRSDRPEVRETSEQVTVIRIDSLLPSRNW